LLPGEARVRLRMFISVGKSMLLGRFRPRAGEWKHDLEYPAPGEDLQIDRLERVRSQG
jgi:hypothetical protein